jgi:chaperone required for assembly of F1-ATPase
MVSMSKAKMEAKRAPLKFYAAAGMRQEADGFCITLDDKPVRTPQGKMLQCSSQQLAQQIAAEWNAQHEHIDTDTMPLTRLLNITIDRVPIDRVALLDDMVGYGGTDLVCYRSPTPAAEIPDPAADALRALQAQHFDPVLAWLSGAHNINLQVTEGIMPIDQSPEALDRIRALLAPADDHTIAALAMMVPLLGSIVLTLAVWQGHIGVEEAIAAAHLDEEVQARYWGADPETEAKRQSRSRDLRAAAFFLTAK